MTPAVSVVVPTRDRAPLLRRLLESLATQTLDEPFEVIVVDDGSRDDTAHLLADPPLPLFAIHRTRGEGPAVARDQGWRAATAPLVAFTDDDCVASPGWLAALVDAARADPGSVVMGRTEPEPGMRQTPFTRTVVQRAAAWPYETCNILYPRELLERLGGFDLRFAHAGEDTDIALRALAVGAPIGFAPAALVHHAVHRLGPLGNLRAATRWRRAVPLFAKHPGLRQAHLHRGIFWSPIHEHLLLALLAAALPRRAWPLAACLAAPYLRRLVWRRSGPLLAPYLLVYDLVETGAVAGAAARERVLVL